MVGYVNIEMINGMNEIEGDKVRKRKGQRQNYLEYIQEQYIQRRGGRGFSMRDFEDLIGIIENLGGWSYLSKRKKVFKKEGVFSRS